MTCVYKEYEAKINMLQGARNTAKNEVLIGF